MLKFVIPFCGSPLPRHLTARLNLEILRKCHQSVISSNPLPSSSHPCLTINIQNHRKNSSNSQMRKFFEYQDVNNEKQDPDSIPYTIWEGAENRSAHSIMEKDERYASTIADVPINDVCKNTSNDDINDLINCNWRFQTTSQIVDGFRKISHHANENDKCIHANKYEVILKSLTKDANLLSDNQLLSILKSLSLWFIEINDHDSNYLRLYTALDVECAKRADSWSVDKMLLVTDHWYKLRLIKKSHFVQKVFIKLAKNPESLSRENLVQLMFYASVSRTTLINLKKVEYGLRKHEESLNIDELSIIASTFFKTQTQIRDRAILANMINKTIDKIDSINEFSLASILKIVRYSIHFEDLGFLCKLLENTIPQIPRLSTACLVHVILAAANRSLFYAELLNAVTAKFHREISKLRLKDIRCLIFALSSFNYVPEKQPHIFESIIQELGETNRQKEGKRFPECFASCIHHLSILNVHPKKLIAQALSPKSIQRAYGSNADTIRRDVFALDLDIEAEIPDYRGPRLDTQTRTKIAMRLTGPGQWPKTSRPTAADYFMLDVIRCCEQYLGSKEMVHVDHVLPQYHRPDIIVCLDEGNSPIPISSIISELPFGIVKHAPKIDSESLKWLALIIGSSNSYAQNTNRLLGHMCAKHRQLENIGYTPYLIFWQDWTQLKTDEQKFKYLQCKVFC